MNHLWNRVFRGCVALFSVLEICAVSAFPAGAGEPGGIQSLSEAPAPARGVWSAVEAMEYERDWFTATTQPQLVRSPIPGRSPSSSAAVLRPPSQANGISITETLLPPWAKTCSILMDPLADKIMVCSAFIAFVDLGWIKAWMVVIVVARELAITGLRLLAASKNVVLAAEGFGKHKTVSQIVAIISILVVHSYPDWGAVGRAIFGWHLPGGAVWSDWVAEASKWVAVVLTFVSGWMYLWRNRALYVSDL